MEFKINGRISSLLSTNQRTVRTSEKTKMHLIRKQTYSLFISLLFLLSCEDIGKGYNWRGETPPGFSRRFGTQGYDYGMQLTHHLMVVLSLWVVDHPKLMAKQIYGP